MTQNVESICVYICDILFNAELLTKSKTHTNIAAMRIHQNIWKVVNIQQAIAHRTR